MKFFLFMVLAGCAVKCDNGGNYYVIEMPEPTATTTTTTTTTNHNRLHVYWNVPTNQCRSKRIPFDNLQQFGIIQNEKDDFRGDKIVIFYDPGLFPAIFQNQTSGKLRYRNGGVPQEGDLEEHLKNFKSVVNQTIPDPNFEGIAIIDFESWRPIFRQNWGDIQLYKEVSYKIERNTHWFWPETWIRQEAKERFEKAARIFMQNTISVAKQMRPHAIWGYYGFPYCFNMAGDHMTESCANGVDAENDQIFWLWLESTGLYPSVYSSNALSSSQLGKMIRGRIREAARVRKTHTPILPYFWFRYREGGFLREVDLQTALQTFNQSEASGFIIWGSSNDVNTVEKCQNLHDYIYKVFGPTIAKYANSSQILEDDIVDIRLENETTTENFDITSTEITSTITDSTTYVTEEGIDMSTITTEDTLRDSGEGDKMQVMKSLIDILLNQPFSGDGVEFDKATTDRKNKTSDNKKVEEVLQSTICNLQETSTVKSSHDSPSKDSKKGKPNDRTTSTDIHTETSTERKIATGNRTILIDKLTHLKPVAKNLTYNTRNPENPTDSNKIKLNGTSGIFQSTTEYQPTEASSYLCTHDNLSKDSKIEIPEKGIAATTENIRNETYKERLQSKFNELLLMTTQDSTYLELHFEEDLNSSSNTENPTISTNMWAFDKIRTKSIFQSTTDNLPTETSTYIEKNNENLSKDSKDGKPNYKTVLTTTENTMTTTYTESVSQSTIDDLTSTETIGSTYSESHVKEHHSKSAKKGIAKHRTNDIENNSAGDRINIFYDQNTFFSQDYSDNSKQKEENEVVIVNDNEGQTLKDEIKGLPQEVFNNTEVITTDSSTTTVSENEYENTETTIEDTVQDDDIKSTNIHTFTFAVTSAPESLTSDTSEQVVVRIV